jgi:peroxiredoxin family protein
VQQPVIVFLNSGAWESVHQGLSIAASAAALGRPVELYFFWWALERLHRGPLDVPDLREDVADELERRGAPTLRQLLEVVRGSGKAQLFACSGSLGALGLTAEEVAKSVDQIVGWTTILQRTAGITDRFFV